VSGITIIRIGIGVFSALIFFTITCNGFSQSAEVSQGIMLRVTATPFLGKVGETILFSADGSQGEIILYEWNFSDGKTGLGKNYRRTFSRPGTYRAILTVTDMQKRRATGMTMTVIRR